MKLIRGRKRQTKAEWEAQCRKRAIEKAKEGRVIIISENQKFLGGDEF